MDVKLLFAQVIALLFWESQLDIATENSSDYTKVLVDKTPKSETVVGTEKGKQALENLKHTINWMQSQPKGTRFEADVLLQRIRLNIAEEEPTLYETIAESLQGNLSDARFVRQRCIHYTAFLRDLEKKDKIAELARAFSQKVYWDRDTLDDWDTVVQNHIAGLEAIAIAREGGLAGITGTVFEGFITETGKIVEQFERGKTELSGEGALKTPWQSINRFFAKSGGGIARGGMTVCSALPFNGKSTFTRMLFRGIAQYNEPYMFNAERKPLLCIISAENEIHKDLMFLYKNCKENETGVKADLEGVTETEMAEYIAQQLGQKGYHVYFARCNPTEYTFRDLFQMVLELESMGYEIHAILFDYLNMISKAGCTQGAMGQDTRDLFRRVRNFMTEHKIAFITPHQIASRAKEMLRQGCMDFVKELPGKGLYDSCSNIDQEVDIELFLHIEKDGRVSYLTVQRGKNRGELEAPPDKDLYVALPFSNVGTIPDDILGEDRGQSAVGGTRDKWGEEAF